MTKKIRKHDSVSVSKILVEKIDNLIKEPESTYTTRASFIEDAIRRHLEKTKKDIIAERQHRDHIEAIEQQSKKQNSIYD